MASQLYNNVTDSLASGAGSSDTTITVSDGTRFTDPGAGNYTPLYIIRASDSAHEIVHITGVSGNDLTVTRSEEGTDPLVFNSGDAVQVRPTRQSLTELDASGMASTTSTGSQLVPGALDERLVYVNTIAERDSLSVSVGQQVSVSGIVYENTGVGAWENLTGHVIPEIFGAVGDGTTVDTAAFQSFLNSGATNLRGSPGKTYLIDTTLLLDNAFETQLDLNGATIKTSTGVNIMRLKNARHVVRNGKFDGDGIDASFLGIIVEGTSTDSIIEYNELFDIGASAIQVQDSADGTKFLKNIITNCGRAPSTTSPPFNVSVLVNITAGVEVLGNVITQCDWGVYFRGTAGSTPTQDYICSENIIRGINVTASQGISNQFGREGTISNNVVSDFHDNAIDSYGGVAVVITGNHTAICKDGVFVGHESSRQCVVSGNTSQDDERGVRIWDTCSDTVVQGNACRNPVFGGIEVNSNAQGTCARIVVKDNTVDCTGSGSYGVSLDNADNCTVAFNTIIETDEEGIRIQNADLTMVSNNQVQDANQSAGGFDAIRHYASSHRSMIDYNIVLGGADAAVAIDGGANSSVRGTRARSISGVAVSDSGATTTLIDNLVV